MASDPAARLALVSAAIDALLGDNIKSYAIEGQQVTRLDLPVLQAEERRLEAKVARVTRRGGAFSVAVPR